MNIFEATRMVDKLMAMRADMRKFFGDGYHAAYSQYGSLIAEAMERDHCNELEAAMTVLRQLKDDPDMRPPWRQLVLCCALEMAGRTTTKPKAK